MNGMSLKRSAMVGPRSLPQRGHDVNAPVAWSSLPGRAKAFRLAHAAFGAINLAGLSYVWLSAATRRRDKWLLAAVGLLFAEGGALIIGRGNCPFGPFQASLGDPVPLFELVLPPRAAKAAIPALAIVTLTGLVALASRPPLSDGFEGSA